MNALAETSRRDIILHPRDRIIAFRTDPDEVNRRFVAKPANRLGQLHKQIDSLAQIEHPASENDERVIREMKFIEYGPARLGMISRREIWIEQTLRQDQRLAGRKRGLLVRRHAHELGGKDHAIGSRIDLAEMALGKPLRHFMDQGDQRNPELCEGHRVVIDHRSVAYR